ncbi:MAG: adenylate/guanylate cyclase domain-containing protein [Leptospiraceae bacterium]|nr:adenylate/guanylate cyclase domain-containing protein [Leptospiraceae bacterium]MCP5513451.1 adenylate/guanylate cyclase domain-containing protein [Leptospiraceae bacterium]
MKKNSIADISLTGKIIFILSLLSLITISVSSFFSEDIYFQISTPAYFLFLILSYPTYLKLSEISPSKQVFGSIWISIVLSISFFIVSQIPSYIPNIFNTIEENSINWRFSVLRSKNGKSSISLEQGYVEKFTPPENARKDIKIIGIKTETLEKYQGIWPIHWQEYAKIINHFKNTSNILFFDIFLVDEKPGEMEAMMEALDDSSNVLLDYAIETNISSKDSIVHFEEKYEVLKKFKLINVNDPDDNGQIWLELPSPPVHQLSSRSAGIGFANIKNDEFGTNRKMPLVAKLNSTITRGETEYYPSIDLLAVCKFYGIDVVNDTEIVMGEYVKLKNIPQKKITDYRGKEFDIMKIPNQEREILIPIDLYGQMDINFVGSLFSFKDEELHEVANDWSQDSASFFENNIFLIGMYYASGKSAAKDAHLSPYGEMSGIEHHAHALNTILNQDFLTRPGRFVKFLLIVLTGILLGFIQAYFKTVGSFLSYFLISAGYLFSSMFLFREMSIVTDLPINLINLTFIFISIIGYKIISEEENVKYIRSTFSKFVSKDIVDELLKDPDKIALGGARREITVFFSDVRGFTSLSEGLTPEVLVKLLNEYLTTMTDSIIQYKGTIDKYMGDAIMAFWGAPVPLEDHAYFACVAALVQIEELKRLQMDWKSRGLPNIDIGIGLNTGFAVVGNMGSSHRMDYTCMGDTINLGSRLEGSNKIYGTRIIISEYTYERVKDRVYTRELDLVKVKGKNKPVRIYELLGLVKENDKELLKKPVQLIN